MNKIEQFESIRHLGNKAKRERSLEIYYKNPNYCLNCGLIIKVLPHQQANEVKTKKFCGSSCAAQHNNRGVNRWANKSSPLRTDDSKGTCVTCGTEISYTPLKGRRGYSKKNYCEECNRAIRRKSGSKAAAITIKKNNKQSWANIDDMTKAEVKEKSGGHCWHMKCNITRWARRNYRASGRPQVCQACGYSLHINVCHIKDIKDYSMDTKIGVINHLDNLVPLCPTHHWEFDHGHLKL
jgi:hypothetical protein